MKSETNKLLSIIERLLLEKINCENAQKEIEALSMEEFPELFGNLYHYLNDEDLRKKDKEYKEFQNEELKKLVNHLETGNIKKANEVSFIHES